MERKRNKPAQSWLAKAREELTNQEELTIERAYELGRIRGKKDAIDKACEWLEMYAEYWLYDDGYFDVRAMLTDFRKAMEEE